MESKVIHKKLFIKIIVFAVTIAFLCQNIAMAAPNSKHYPLNALRSAKNALAPSHKKETMREMQKISEKLRKKKEKQANLAQISKLKQRFDKFSRILALPKLEDRKQLGFEILMAVDVVLSIRECFQQYRPNLAGKIAVSAIQSNIPGITPDDVKGWIRECFQKERPDLAGEIAVLAIQSNIPGITSDDVKRSIRECFQKEGPDLAGEIAVSAIQSNIPDITPDDVKRWIRECSQKERPDWAGKIAISAIQSNIPDITPDDVKESIHECYKQKRPDWAGKIAVLAIQSNIPGITPDYVKRSIRECFQKKWPWEAGEIAISAIQSNIPDVTPDDVKRSIRECFQQELPFWAGEIAVSAIQSNIPDITPDDVKGWIRECYKQEQPDWAGKIAVSAIQSNIPDITPDDVKESIHECYKQKQPDWAGEIAISAIQSNIPGITPDDVKRSIHECFQKERPDWAGKIAVLAIQSNIPGIPPDDVKRSICECFQKEWPWEAGEIAVSAIQSNIPGITPDNVKRSIRECFHQELPGSAGKIAVLAAKNIKFSKKVSKTFDFLNDSRVLPKGSSCLTASLISYVLEKDMLDSLPEILFSVKENERILPLLMLLSSTVGIDEIAEEIAKEGGVESFVKLYESFYPYMFSDILPDEVDMSNKRIKALLDTITHFITSKFSRFDLSVEEIYQQYKEDYKAGKIKPMPENIPPPKVIEVATIRSQAHSGDAKKYYSEMMKSVQEALFALDTSKDKTILPQQKPASKLLKSIEQRISSQQEAKEQKGLPEKAIDLMNDQIKVLNEAKDKISVSLEEETFVLLSLNKEHLSAISGIKDITPVLRTLLFMHSLRENQKWYKHFRRVRGQEAFIVNIKEFVSFVDSFVKPHILGGLEENARKGLLKHASSKIFREEIDRLSGAKGELTKKIRITPTRGWLAEFVGYFSDECWTETRNILCDNPDAVVLIFSDEETGDILGGTLLMPNSIEGKKVLIDRGLSPRTSVTAMLSTDDFVSKVADYEEEIARSMGAEKIVVPFRGLEAGLGTNNPDIIQYYERNLSSKNPINLDIPNTFNHHDITKGKCVVFREVAVTKLAEEAKLAVKKHILYKQLFQVSAMSKEDITYYLENGLGQKTTTVNARELADMVDSELPEALIDDLRDVEICIDDIAPGYVSRDAGKMEMMMPVKVLSGVTKEGKRRIRFTRGYLKAIKDKHSNSAIVDILVHENAKLNNGKTDTEALLAEIGKRAISDRIKLEIQFAREYGGAGVKYLQGIVLNKYNVIKSINDDETYSQLNREKLAALALEVYRLSVRELIKRLDVKDLKERAQLVAFFVRLDDEMIVDELIVACDYPRNTVIAKTEIIKTLGYINNEKAIGPLKRYLFARDWSIHISAVEALGQMGDMTVINYLIKLISDPEWNSHLVPRRLTKEEKINGVPQNIEVSDLLCHADTIILFANDLRFFAVGALAEICKRNVSPDVKTMAVQSFINALKDKDKMLRRAAALKLGELRANDSVNELIERLNDEDELVQAYAAQALGLIGDKKALDELNRMFEGKEMCTFTHNSVSDAIDRLTEVIEIDEIRRAKPEQFPEIIPLQIDETIDADNLMKFQG